MKHFWVFMLDKNCPNYRSKIFAHLDWLREMPNFNDYEEVYDGNIEGDTESEMCENIFRLLNIYHPDDYKHRSLSVSDVVRVGDNYYYCDAYGFKKLNW